jgi:hypothetical protein
MAKYYFEIQFPPFNIEQIEAIAATHRGYDWLLHDA